MGNYCVVVASGAQARFFILEPAEFPELGIGPNLVERGELINPEKEIARRDLYTDSVAVVPLMEALLMAMMTTVHNMKMNWSAALLVKSWRKPGVLLKPTRPAV
jgi:hypothetical protein